MPGVDYAEIRRTVTIAECLQKLGWQATRRRGAQCRGACPVCATGGHVFSVNLQTNRWFCHRCHAGGNVLELWALVTHLSIYAAAIDLCKTLGRKVPTISKW